LATPNRIEKKQSKQNTCLTVTATRTRHMSTDTYRRFLTAAYEKAEKVQIARKTQN